ncbi:MAG: anthranilate phosphoribosyltransferase [Thermodesulfobacteria bacterium]|nr:anthranilate phosphoribosyltransferase [Thermodesulfobacteriota bacterium]
MSAVTNALKKVVEFKDLSAPEMEDVMGEIMEGRATDAQIGALLTGLRMKGEVVDEILGAAKVMRSKAHKISPRRKEGELLLDIVGTGGDQAGTFNVSTTTAFVVAGAGLKVAKHGNRSVSSKSGSADLLEELGVKLDVEPAVVERCIEEIGLGFLFAPMLHPAMKNVIGPRRQMGIRTIFNMLGPLTNPASAEIELMGIYSRDLCKTMAQVLGELGAKKAWVVHGHGGMDELSISGPTHVAQWDGESVEVFDVTPGDFGLNEAPLSEIAGGDPQENARITRQILAGNPGPKRDMVVMNAAAAIFLGGKAKDLKEAAQVAQQSIDSGSAQRVLERLVELTSSAGEGA